MDDPVWVPTVFMKNRERLIRHNAVVEFFKEVLCIAQKKKWLSGEHSCVDGTTIQAWAGYKSFVLKDGDDSDKDDGSGEGGFKGSKPSNETHESRTAPDARLFRKGKTASELRYMGHTLTDNRHGLVVNARVSGADGHAERELSGDPPEAKNAVSVEMYFQASARHEGRDGVHDVVELPESTAVRYPLMFAIGVAMTPWCEIVNASRSGLGRRQRRGY
jgi:hypothetical protein